jgi:hypothetical protein
VIGEGLPAQVLGTDDRGQPVEISVEHRYRGTLIAGPPGKGKSELMTDLMLQDARHGAAMLVVDAHETIDGFLGRLPRERHRDVVLLSVLADEVPMWPALSYAESSDERGRQCEQLIAAWRAIYGEESIGARSANVALNAFLTAPGLNLSPIELMQVLMDPAYRYACLDALKTDLNYHGLCLAWKSAAQNGRTFLEWAQPVINKLGPMMFDKWLLRTLGGASLVPSNRQSWLPGEAALEPDVAEVTWLGHGAAILRRRGNEVAFGVNLDNILDSRLLRSINGQWVASEHLLQGACMEIPPGRVDKHDPILLLPSEGERAKYGMAIDRWVQRRRQRRGFERFAELELEPRGIHAQQVINIEEMLDLGRIILVEIPQMRGPQVQATVAALVLTAVTQRGYRTVSFPEDRRRPVAVYMDEAGQFSGRWLAVALEQLRKANTSFTVAIQHLDQLSRGGGDLKAILSTAGSFVSLGSGMGDRQDVARLLEVTEEEVEALPRGEMFVKGLTDNWSLSKARRAFRDEIGGEDASQAADLRRSSSRQFNVSTEAADAVCRSRNLQIQVARQPYAKPTGSARTNLG